MLNFFYLFLLLFSCLFFLPHFLCSQLRSPSSPLRDDKLSGNNNNNNNNNNNSHLTKEDDSLSRELSKFGRATSLSPTVEHSHSTRRNTVVCKERNKRREESERREGGGEGETQNHITCTCTTVTTYGQETDTQQHDTDQLEVTLETSTQHRQAPHNIVLHYHPKQHKAPSSYNTTNITTTITLHTD